MGFIDDAVSKAHQPGAGGHDLRTREAYAVKIANARITELAREFAAVCANFPHSMQKTDGQDSWIVAFHSESYTVGLVSITSDGEWQYVRPGPSRTDVDFVADPDAVLAGTVLSLRDTWPFNDETIRASAVEIVDEAFQTAIREFVDAERG